MTFARRLRFRASLMKIGVDGLAGVARDRATAYGYTLTGRKTAPATDFDPFSAQTMRDPYPGYRALLTGPNVPNVWYNRKRGIWIIAGYDDVRKALRDHEALSSAESQSPVSRPSAVDERGRSARPHSASQIRLSGFHPAGDDGMASGHQRGRRRTRRRHDCPRKNRGGVRAGQTAPEPTDRHDAGNTAARSRTVPGVVRCDGRGFLRAVDPARNRPSSARSAAATAAMRRNLDRLITHRRRHPGDDLISMMTHADGDDVLTDDEIFWSAAMLIGAGSETTTNLLSGLLLTLAQQPDLYAQLREHPELIPAAIEEQLRFVSPVQGFYRTATRDYTVGANTIPAGARVLLLFAAANRDPRHFDDPDTFDLNRNPSDHLAFGGGIHYCLGTPLSRLEASRVLTQLLPRVDAIRLDGDYRYLDNPTMRGLAHLPLELVPARPGVTATGTTRRRHDVRISRKPVMRRRTVEMPRALQPVRAEPGVDSFSDGSPPGLQHHVVTHVGEEFCFGAICARRRKYFFSGMGAVIIGA